MLVPDILMICFETGVSHLHAAQIIINEDDFNQKIKFNFSTESNTYNNCSQDFLQ